MLATFISWIFLTAAMAVTPEEGAGLMQKYGCAACHQIDRTLVGPAYNAVANQYRTDPDAKAKLFSKIKNGGSGTWGQLPMPSNVSVPDKDIQKLVEWILSIQ